MEGSGQIVARFNQQTLHGNVFAAEPIKRAESTRLPPPLDPFPFHSFPTGTVNAPDDLASTV